VPEYLVKRDIFTACALKNDLTVTSWTPFKDYYTAAMQNPEKASLALKTKVISNKNSIAPDPLAWDTAQLYVVVELIRK
jgi:hypothetical protein